MYRLNLILPGILIAIIVLQEVCYMARKYSVEAHWRDSARPARFFIIDYRGVFPIVLFLLHIQFWTFYIAIAGIIFFAILERYGFTVPVFLRFVRSFLAGRQKTASPWWRQ